MALGISSFPISGKATQSQTPLSAFRKLRSWPVITILLLVAFLLDLLLPAGLAIPLLYVLAVVLLVALPDKKDKLVVATSCTILILVDSFFTRVTVGNSYWLPVIDHGLTVIMIWTVAVLGLRHSRAENALRQSEERFRALVQASAQIVWTTNAEGHRVEDSPSWRAFTGQSSDQSKGSGWLNAYHPDDHNRVLSNWRRVLSDKTPLEAQYRLRRHDGQWRWTLVRAVPLAATDGSLRGWVGMNTDITRRKQVEADTLFLLDLSECIRLAANAD
ncbi:MAG TPA: PAS domain S-box protein, partial [Terriglobales bacterium]|nr:PAS domain S-box protein [Terriglobales bacterium]